MTHHRIARAKQRARASDSRRAVTYGLTGTAYRSLLEIQNGVCAICARSPVGKKRQLAVDHDHSCCPGPRSCGRCVRGLLCWSCNKFLHHIGDDVNKIENALGYLQNWPSWKLDDPDPTQEISSVNPVGRT